jgi:hypothetical protein
VRGTTADRLLTHLAGLIRQGVITAWHDHKINPGAEWVDEINAHLNSAQIILFLISADFLASDYCYGVEVRRALERHEAGEARVIPIILRACDWGGTPFAKLQALPKDANPVTSFSDRDKAFAEIAEGIMMAAERSKTG